jgi:ribosome-associated protein
LLSYPCFCYTVVSFLERETDMDESLQVIKQLAKALDDKKAFNIMVLDIKGLSSIADYFIIAEGSVDRHLEAIADNLLHTAKELGMQPLHTEGRGGDWLVIDFAGIMTHLMLPATRERYRLERIWQEGKLVQLDF